MQVLETMKFKTMTPIQAKAIPALLAGKDVLGSAKLLLFLFFTVGLDPERRWPSSSR